MLASGKIRLSGGFLTTLQDFRGKGGKGTLPVWSFSHDARQILSAQPRNDPQVQRHLGKRERPHDEGQDTGRGEADAMNRSDKAEVVRPRRERP